MVRRAAIGDEMSDWPSLFISHGAPTLLIEDSPTRSFLQRLGEWLGRPRAILCVSAHWETDEPAVTAGSHPETIYDFYGFPRALYEHVYPAPGDPELARKIRDRIAAAGMPARLDPNRGLDHGAWVPLSLMYPRADIPVLQLSVQPSRGPDHHLTLGRALQPLRGEDVLILGSGSLTHNLQDVMRRLRSESEADRNAVVPWAAEFEQWVDGVLMTGDWDALARYRGLAPEAALAHPTVEHLLPLHAAAGAGGGPGAPIHRAFAYGSLSMAAYAFPEADWTARAVPEAEVLAASR
jgi:4,5-DOPA dioxygenase extradiol